MGRSSNLASPKLPVVHQLFGNEAIRPKVSGPREHFFGFRSDHAVGVDGRARRRSSLRPEGRIRYLPIAAPPFEVAILTKAGCQQCPRFVWIEMCRGRLRASRGCVLAARKLLPTFLDVVPGIIRLPRPHDHQAAAFGRQP